MDWELMDKKLTNFRTNSEKMIEVDVEKEIRRFDWQEQRTASLTKKSENHR